MPDRNPRWKPALILTGGRDVAAIASDGRSRSSCKWIKQNLSIKHFFGNSVNAVKSQIWIAARMACTVYRGGNRGSISTRLEGLVHEWSTPST